jgi:hypothetical protein
MTDRYFRVKYKEKYFKLKKISAGQGSVLGPVLFLLYTSDIPNLKEVKTATFADDTTILATEGNVEESTSKLQRAATAVSNWTKKWRIKLNETKSTHINFTNCKINRILIEINSQKIPYANTAKYLGMTLDAKLKWKEHIKKKGRRIKHQV